MVHAPVLMVTKLISTELPSLSPSLLYHMFKLPVQSQAAGAWYRDRFHQPRQGKVWYAAAAAGAGFNPGPRSTRKDETTEGIKVDIESHIERNFPTSASF